MKRYTTEDKAKLIEEISRTTLPIKKAYAAVRISQELLRFEGIKISLQKF